MCQKENNKSDKKWQHITKKERYLIEHLYNKQKLKAAQIARELGKNRSTICRELSLGKVEQLKVNPYVSRNPNVPDYLTFYVYVADIAQKKHDAKAGKKGPKPKISQDAKLKKYLEKTINMKYSPEVLAHRIAQNPRFKTKLSTNTIYSYIDKKLININRTHLTYGRYKPKSKEKCKEKASTTEYKKGRTIHDRPHQIELKQEIGHWEMDTVEGKQGKSEAVLLVLTERATNMEIIKLMKSKQKSSVIAELDKLEKELGAKAFREKFKTITMDNGGEFRDYLALEKSIFNKKLSRTKVFYADSYSAWQRGSNENANKFIRRFLPKYTTFNRLTELELVHIEQYINNYPRKKFGFKSANFIYNNSAA